MTEDASQEAHASNPSLQRTKTAGYGAFPLFDPKELAALGNRNMEFMARAARAYVAGTTQMNREFAEFVNARIRRDFEAVQSLMSAKCGEDALCAQADFVESAIEDYAKETSKVFSIAADIAKAALKRDE